jgi:hypothetical protein
MILSPSHFCTVAERVDFCEAPASGQIVKRFDSGSSSDYFPHTYTAGGKFNNFYAFINFHAF